MFKDRLNKNEVKILISIQKGPLTISQLANALDKRPSWISRNVKHLRKINFVIAKREGKKVFVSLNQGALGASISCLVSEATMLNIESILSDSGLRVLPFILKPGNSAKTIALKSSLSLRTLHGLLSRWRKMGVVTLANTFYTLNERYKPLIDFVETYTYDTIIRTLNKSFPAASIIWHWRNEFMFSIEHPVSDNRFMPAATTRLLELNYNIISSKEYYYYNPLQKIVSEEEALIQGYIVDPENPRIHRLIKRDIKNEIIDKVSLLNYAKKYGLKKKIEELVENA